MKGNIRAAIPPRPAWSRRSPRLTAATAVAVAVILGGAGVAGASNGRAFILGRHSSESSTATLAHSKGTPLSLSAPQHQAPLKVNRNVEVKNLNSQYVGGLSAASLKTAGGTGSVAPNSDIQLGHDTFTKVARTGSIPAGTYYVQAAAEGDVSPGDTGVHCTVGDNSGNLYGGGGGNGSSFVQATETLVLKLKHRGTFQEQCLAEGSGSGTEIIDGGITALRIASSKGTAPPGGGILITRR
jgi:hypothetical protein